MKASSAPRAGGGTERGAEEEQRKLVPAVFRVLLLALVFAADRLVRAPQEGRASANALESVGECLCERRSLGGGVGE